MFFTLYVLYLIGVNISIISSPAGTSVNGSNNIFDYPILTSVNLLCNVTIPDGSPVTVTSYRWTATNCYNRTGGIQSPCFYSRSHTGNNITDNSLLAPDAGTVTCSATIAGVDVTSDPLTLRIAGKDIFGTEWYFMIFSYVDYNFCYKFQVENWT